MIRVYLYLFRIGSDYVYRAYGKPRGIRRDSCTRNIVSPTHHPQAIRQGHGNKRTCGGVGCTEFIDLGAFVKQGEIPTSCWVFPVWERRRWGGELGAYLFDGSANGSGDVTSELGGDYRFAIRVINGLSVEKLEHGAQMYVYDD